MTSELDETPLNGADDETPASQVVGLHIAPATRLPMRSVESVETSAGRGLAGDRYEGARHRHVTVQSLEELGEAAERFGAPFDPGMTRRNITISRGPVPRTPGQRWRVGPVELEVVRDAAPCALMDETFGPGARAALRRRAGVVCRVIGGGEMRVGDMVELEGVEPGDVELGEHERREDEPGEDR